MRKIEFLVGLFVLAAIGGLIILAISVSGLNKQFQASSFYEVEVPFSNVGGLRVRAPVMIGGVRIGQVEKIELDKNFNVIVTLKVDSRFDNIPSDSFVSILTTGLLGEQFVGVNAQNAGFGDTVWKNGLKIETQITQSAISLEQLIGQVMFSSNSKGDSK